MIRDSDHARRDKTLNSELSQAKMRQLGMVVKGYRDAAGLSQEGLSELLKEYAPYEGSRDRSQISNYERGKVLPSREFLTALLNVIHPRLLAKGIELDEQDTDHLLFIAGYFSQPATDVSDLRTSVKDVKAGQATLHADVQNVQIAQARIQGGLQDLSQRVSGSLSVNERAKDALVKMVPAALYVATIGYAIDALGLFRTWVMLAYLCVGIGVVVGTVMMRRLRTHASDRLGDLFFVSVFFVLSAPLLQAAFTRMDHFGFHTIQEFTGSPFPFMLAVLANLVLALVTSTMFNVLRNWLYGRRTVMNPITCALAATLPPLLFTYTNVLIFCNPGMWIFFLGALSTLLGGFAAILAFNDPELRLDDRDSWLVKATFAVILVVSISWSAWNLATYIEPSVVSSAHHNTIWSSDPELEPLDAPTPEYFDALGYPETEYIERIRFGSLWTGQATAAYVIIVIGFNVFATIRNRIRDSIPTLPERL